ncbi:MAG: hypothetical protein NZ960_01320 [Candidatus Kapabacteria bacterium]|nr:hypothetical protein [Candidatus Kapabacteria bacterium]MDW8011667.1 hypothetical protein [Bacteroidota bacterium]
MHIRTITMLSSLLVLSLSCTCPELQPDPFSDVRVREATITQFDPRWDAARGVPVPTYSIHTFLFPSTPASSGSLPNDDRIALGQLLVLGQQSFVDQGQTYTAQAVTVRPPNWTMQGDWMVVEVDPTTNPPEAWIRVAGWIERLPDPLLSASAEDFVNYLRARLGQLNAAARSASLFGRGLPTQRATDDVVLRVLDAQGNDVTGTVPVPLDIVQLLSSFLQPALDIRVRIGEVYYYRAKSGAEFAVLIEDIRPGTLPPNLNRVTIKFAQVLTVEGCRTP